MFEKLEDRHYLSANPIADPLDPTGDEIADALAAAASGINLNSLPNDPLLPYQWHIFNTGQVELGVDQLLQPLYGVPGEDANVLGAWNMGYTGAGVVVAVVDSGIQLDHPDLVDNLHPFLGYDAILDRDRNDTPDAGSPSSQFDPGQAHGTAVGGIIGATANNGIGGAGIAPGVELVPIRLIDEGQTPEAFAKMFQFGLQDDPNTPYDDVIDIYNHSWGPGVEARLAIDAEPIERTELIRSVREGRNGLGAIHIWASGNSGEGDLAGESGGPLGPWRYTGLNGWANNIYGIVVTGVDHDGREDNSDGTLTQYPEAGPNVLVAAPTGSNSYFIGPNPLPYGSGIWTTDFYADPSDPLSDLLEGYNTPPDENGFEIDNDPLLDTSYTSRFNGTSAAAPMVTGVVALMLEANPDLTYRDVQEILVRSARQPDPFESLATGAEKAAGFSYQSTWITNRNEIFRDPEFFNLANHDLQGDRPVPPPDGDEFAHFVNDGRFDVDPVGPYLYNPSGVLTPNQYTNGAGYTVSYGRGFLGSATGYGHGIIDAELAVTMAAQWTTNNQMLAPQQTWTTAAQEQGTGLIPAHAVTSQATGFLVVPGRLGGNGNVAWYNAYPSGNFQGLQFTDGAPLAVPIDNSPESLSAVEWVEVKVEFDTGDIENLRMTLVSPNGVHSELNHFFDTAHDPPNVSSQYEVYDNYAGEPGDNYDITPGDGSFAWTFTTNRHWGERTDSNLLIDPATGEPYIFAPEQSWELHFENYGDTDINLVNYEVVFHGTALGVDTKRIQGFVGLDENNDDVFNFERSVQFYRDYNGPPLNPFTIVDVTQPGIQIPLQLEDDNGPIFDANNPIPGYNLGDISAESFQNGALGFDRLGEVERFGDLTQEKFASNVLVELYARQLNGAEVLADQFLTGNDGNYFFDVAEPLGADAVLGTDVVDYVVRVVDGEGRMIKEDPNAPTDFMQKYKAEWVITPEHFLAWDHDRAPVLEELVPDPDFGFDIPINNVDGVPSVIGNYLADRLMDDPTYLTQFSDADVQTQVAGGYTWVFDPRIDYDIQLDPVTGLPVAWIDPFTGATAEDHARGINFLLTEGPPPAQEVVFSGNVFSDKDANGVFDGADNGKGQIRVYHDANQNGTFDPGELFTFTDDGTLGGDLGDYQLVVPTTQLTAIQIGVELPPNFVNVNPSDGLVGALGEPGDVFNGVDFAITPGDNPGGGGGGNVPGRFEGIVYVDDNADGQKQASEVGIAGVTVWLDDDNDGEIDPEEQDSIRVTNVGGAYEYSGLGAGTYTVRVVTPDTYGLTQPGGDGSYQFVFTTNDSLTNINFGWEDLAYRDFGDLDLFPTNSEDGGAWHRISPGVRLGALIDGEVNGQPNAGGTGDDDNGFNDDDGIIPVFGADGLINDGETISFKATTVGTGFMLNAWIDLNGNGSFDDPGEHVYDDLDLNPGFEIDLPSITVGDVPEGVPISARFRWGEGGLDYNGGAMFGEVEDYVFQAALGQNVILPGDYDANGTVNQADYDVWLASVGATGTGLDADGNGDGVVDSIDYAIWRENLGATSSPASASSGGATTLSLSGGQTTPVVYPDLESHLSSLGLEIGYQKIGFGASAQLVPLYQPLGTNAKLATTAIDTLSTPPQSGSYFMGLAVSDDVLRAYGFLADETTGPSGGSGAEVATPQVLSTSVSGKLTTESTVVGLGDYTSVSSAAVFRANQVDLALELEDEERSTEDEIELAAFSDEEDTDQEALAVALEGDLFI